MLHLLCCAVFCCVVASSQAFLAVPILASGGGGQVIGVLSFGSTHHLDWSREWWMPSCQLICGWAAGALPQARAVLRVNFFDLLAQEEDLDQVAARLVRQLPNVLVDEVGRGGRRVWM
jgi:hypothetical protein